MIKNAKKSKKELLKMLKDLRESIARNPSPIFKMSKEDVIKTLRKTREEIWEEKVALRH